jgi:AraC-like DNA-binding protein
MQYIECAPGPRLAKYIRCFWQLQDDASTSNSAEPVLPDGSIEIVFNLADTFRRHHADTTIETQPKTIIVGQMRGPAMIQAMGRVSLFGIRFKPCGAFPFLRTPLSELTDQIPSLDCILNGRTANLEERINLASSFRERIMIMESVLSGLMDEKALSDTHSGEHRACMAAERIAETDGCISIDELVNEFGLSSRHLGRQFLNTVGIGPKLLARIFRFQKVFRALSHQTVNWSAIAYDCGYYDQAHLIRDFREFAGQNPTGYLEGEHNISDCFTKKDSMSDFSNTRTRRTDNIRL